MGLTRPKYSQIYDSDYKNSVRVATTASVTLIGGAPDSVDDIALSVGDRVLVRVQNDATQNGIYRVNTLGTGANGTWGRSLDADTSAKLTSGSTVNVEEGTTNAGKMFRMTTAGTITLGTSEITWTDVSGGGGATTGGTNLQVQYNDNNNLNGAIYLYYVKSTGQVVANSGLASTSTTTGALKVTGGAGISGELYVGANLTITGNLLPSANVTYNLGSPSQRWKDLYLSGTTINLNGATISAHNGVLTFQNGHGGSFSVTGTAAGQSTGSFGNLTANSGIASTSTSTGALTVTGGAGISGNIYAGSIQNTPIGSTTASSGAFTTLTSSSTTKASGNIVAGSGTTSTNTTSGALVVVGGIGASGAIYAGSIQNTPIGSTTATTGAFTTLTSSSTTISSGNIVAGSGTASSSTTTGALVVVGGLGVSGIINLNQSGSTANVITVNGGNISGVNRIWLNSGPDKGITWFSGNGWAIYESPDNLTTNSGGNLQIVRGNVRQITVDTDGIVRIPNTQSSTSSVTGALVVSGGLGVSGQIYNSNILVNSGNVVANSGTTSSSTTTGALVVDGGMGVSGAAYIGGQVNATNTTASSSTSTGALVVAGGIGVAKDSYFGANLTIVGNLVVQGNNLSISTATLSIQDPILNLHSTSDNSALTVDDGADIGIKIHYYKGGDQSAFLGWVNSTGYLEWFDSGSDSGNVFTGTTRGTIRSGQIIVANTTTSTSTTTGALTVAGGAGIAGSLFVGANVTATGYLMPSANLTYDIGSGTTWWRTFYGVSTQAKYADLAENYLADSAYGAGTVLVFGGLAEVTTTDISHDTRVAGIVSTDPAHLMNGGLVGENVVALGLTGRLPCKVLGPVEPGDVLVTSTVPGVAQKIDNTKFAPGCVVGKSLGRINTNMVSTIEVVVGRF